MAKKIPLTGLLLLCAWLLIGILPAEAQAEACVIEIETGEKDTEGEVFFLYRIGEILPDGRYGWREEIGELGAELFKTGREDEIIEWMEQAEKCLKKHAPDAMLLLDENGSGEAVVREGVYLILQKPSERYAFQKMLLSVPEFSDRGTVLAERKTLYPKFRKHSEPEKPSNPPTGDRGSGADWILLTSAVLMLVILPEKFKMKQNNK